MELLEVLNVEFIHLTFAGNSPKETIGRKEDFDFRKYFSKSFNTFIVHNFATFLNAVAVDETYFSIYISKQL